MGCFSRGALHRNPTILLCPWRNKHRVRPDNHSTTSASPLETPAPPQTESPSSLPVCSRLLRDRDPDHPHLHRPGFENLHRQQKHRDLVLRGDQPGCKLDFAVSSSPFFKSKETNKPKMYRLSSPAFPRTGLCSSPSLPPSTHTETARPRVLTRLALFAKARGRARGMRAERAISSLYMSPRDNRLLRFDPGLKPMMGIARNTCCRKRRT